MPRSFRVLPALLVSALLLLALSTSAKRTAIPAADANSALAGPCLQYQSGGSGSIITLGTGQGVTQPVGFVGNVASCSLSVQGTYSHGLMQVVAWDPTTLTPDPTTLALGTVSFNESALVYGNPRGKFYPPVIVESAPHVAELLRPIVAIRYMSEGWNTQNLGFEHSGDPLTPAALQFDPAGHQSPLPGAHPLLAHAVCGGDENVQDLRVLQSVITTNTIVADTSSEEVVQLFTVPVPSAIYWAEIAPGGTPAPRTGVPDVAILEAHDTTVPPAIFENTDILAQQFLGYYLRPAWTAAYDFAQRPVLEPGHKYWLRVRSFKNFALHGRTRVQPEAWDFTFGVGPLYKRRNKDSAWEPLSETSLSFRLIGEQTGPGWVGVSPSSPSASLRLRISPNPARGNAVVNWTGAQGSVRLMVLDARGRRVAASQVTGGEGQWRFAAFSGDGTPLPAGVYFVRAIDARGTAVTERVVIQR